MTSSARRAEARQEFIALLITQVERDGRVSFTEDLRGDFDDPPEHYILKFARINEEIEAAMENRRPHLEAPKTLMVELRKVCDERGWELGPDSMERGKYWIVAPEKPCEKCTGRGRILVYDSMNLSELMQSGMGGAITGRVTECPQCKGTGKTR